MVRTFVVTLPDIGEGVVEGEVIEWLKNEGDPIAQDEPVVMVMTDKATVELPAPYPGALHKQYHKAGDIAIKDRPLYEIAVADDVELPDAPAAAPEAPAAHPKKEKPSRTRPCPAGRSSASGTLATPAVRGLAKKMGIDLAQISGTGPEGRILSEDLHKPTSVPVANSTPMNRLEGDEEIPVIGIRKYIADKMSEAKRIIPDFAYFEEMDAERLVVMRKRGKEEAAKHGVRLTFTPYFIRALSMTLTKYPILNSSFDHENQKILVHQPHNIGIAMKTERGVIVPVLKNVQDMSFQKLVTEFCALKERAMTHKLANTEMKEATITLTNFGTEGGLFATPVINYPEVVILGLGSIYEKPIAKEGQVVIGKRINASWCGDHRVLDGDVIAHAATYFSRLIKNPGQLLNS